MKVAFFFVDSVKRYFAYVGGTNVGYITRREQGKWCFIPEWSSKYIFPPPQRDEIHQTCRDAANALNITARLTS